ncbi:hypothetical protein EV644_101960 [Kribbella orskensis]|uniref:Uncharacterized protein n=1 Tax=Kribbella orskensis TaxID=2512216 RepID=A0ABY2BVX3_9ACTN|nr:hypothetical protein EV644_101960 [Kribbella orskensis]
MLVHLIELDEVQLMRSVEAIGTEQFAVTHDRQRATDADENHLELAEELDIPG